MFKRIILERLHFAILPIENSIARSLNFVDVIHTFAKPQSLRKDFY